MTYQQVPNVIFHTRKKDEDDNYQWVDVTSEDIFKDKKVLVFALPGAFTPTCSSKHLPRYEELYDELRNYCDEIYCLSVNDTFVMNAWFKQLGINRVKPLPDGNGEFTRRVKDSESNSTSEYHTTMGRVYDNLGFGSRSHRYSMIVLDGTIVKMFSEDRTVDGDPYEVSDADTMLNYLKEQEKNGRQG